MTAIRSNVPRMARMLRMIRKPDWPRVPNGGSLIKQRVKKENRKAFEVRKVIMDVGFLVHVSETYHRSVFKVSRDLTCEAFFLFLKVRRH